jgi:signal transduction histidine kinase
MLSELYHEWQHRFQQEGTQAAFDVDDDTPIFYADKPLMKRVFSNLIQNAVSHSSRPIRLAMNAKRSGDSILFTFADDGPGIPPEYHEVIFRKFGQVSSGVITPRVRSSGLGLTFCKLVVDLHGGMIWVRSREGEGSSFHVELPISSLGGADQSETRVRIRGSAFGG